MNTKKIKALSHLDWATKLKDICVKEMEKEEKKAREYDSFDEPLDPFEEAVAKNNY